jgi:hypothetical protein
VTALTIAARIASPRPLPWRRMAWVIWRQHRLGLAGVGAMFAVIAGYLLLTGVQMHDASAVVTGCQPAASAVCQKAANDFFTTYSQGAVITGGVLLFVPGLLGAFVGAPLLAREFESGTFRYVFTQGVGRVRWTIAKLVPLTIAVTGSAAAFSALFSWAYRPIIGPTYGLSPMQPLMFAAREVAFPGWTLVTLAIGALAGILIRRVIPAMFATLAAWAALAFTTGLFLRGHYLPPVVTTDPNIAEPDWVLDQQWYHGGAPASLSTIDGALRPIGIHAVTPELYQAVPGARFDVDPVQYLVQHGFTHLTTYQPATRFWLFQGIEGGWLLLLSIVLLGTTVWLVRRRAT